MLKIGDKIVCINNSKHKLLLEYGKEYYISYVSNVRFRILSLGYNKEETDIFCWFKEEEFDEFFMTKTSYERMKKLEIC